jgi:hypothetical protein
MVSDLRAYYLIRGVIIQVVQEDAASGMSEVHLPGGFRTRGSRWGLALIYATGY